MDFKRIFKKEKDIEQYIANNIKRYKKQLVKIANDHDLTQEQIEQSRKFAREFIETLWNSKITKGTYIFASETFYREFCVQMLFSMSDYKNSKNDSKKEIK